MGVSYLFQAREEEFVAEAGVVFRHNQIWRSTYDDHGAVVAEELIKTNRARVVYHPEPSLIRVVS